MNIFQRTQLLAITGLILVTPAFAGESKEDRIWMDLKINGQPVRMALDTGASTMVMFQRTADRLGIYVTNPPSASKGAYDRGAPVQVGWTEPCKFSGLGNELTLSFAVLGIPPGIRTETEGLVGWDPIKGNILLIEAEKRHVHWLGEIPDAAAGWSRFPMLTNLGVLGFNASPGTKARAVIAVDTGNGEGVSLKPAAWRAWKQAHPKAPTTLAAHYMPGAGIQVQEVVWAESLELGGLALSGVPVRPSNPVEVSIGGEGYLASLGLAALERLEFIVDGERSEVRWRPRASPAKAPRHNRLGAVFSPKNMDTDPLLATVLPGTPAAEAGIRKGDQLLAVDGLDVTVWRTDPQRLKSYDGWQGAAGTQHELKLKRGAETRTVKVILRDLIGPTVGGSKVSPRTP